MKIHTALIFVVVLLCAPATHAQSDFMPDGQPPESSQRAADEMYECVGSDLGKMTECQLHSKFFNAHDFFSLSEGCMNIPDREKQMICNHALEKTKQLLQ